MILVRRRTPQTNRARNHAFWPILWNSQFVEHLSSKSKMMLKYWRSLIFELFFITKNLKSVYRVGCIGWYVTCFTKDRHIRICTFISHQSDCRLVVFFFFYLGPIISQHLDILYQLQRWGIAFLLMISCKKRITQKGTTSTKHFGFIW